jgi:hypothetical protein
MSLPKESVCISNNVNSLKKSRFEKAILAINENIKLFEETEHKETKILVTTIKQIINLTN